MVEALRRGGFALDPFGGSSVEVAIGAKSPEGVGCGLLEDGLKGGILPASSCEVSSSGS